MKKVAIITSGFAPVPAVDSGAVETLTTYIIEDNENNDNLKFDIYTINDKRLDSFSYKNTLIKQIHVSKIEKFIEKICNKCLREIKVNRLLSIYNYKLVRELKKIECKYDVVIFENLMDNFSSIYKILGDTRYILHLHNDLNPISKSVSMANAFVKANCRILAVSNYIRNSFISKTLCGIEQCKVLYNCIDMSRDEDIIFHSANSSDDIRTQIGINKDDFVLLFVGRLNEEKGIYELARAFSMIHNDDIKLIVCGGTWGSEFRNNRFLKQIYDVLGEKISQVTFTGYIAPENIKKYYILADVVVIPSIVQEAFGMVMLEAAFLGKTIIATRSGGMVEILPEECAYFVDINEQLSENLAEKIKFCYENRYECKIIGKQARDMISNRKEFVREEYYKNFLVKSGIYKEE